MSFIVLGTHSLHYHHAIIYFLISFCCFNVATLMSFMIRDIPSSMILAGIQVLLPGGIGVQASSSRDDDPFLIHPSTFHDFQYQ